MKILADILGMTIVFAVPLLLVALGGMFSERSGVINIALEGIMIIGALFGTLTMQYAPSWGLPENQLSVFVAILVAGLMGMVYSLLLAYAAVDLKADQTIGGTALNIFPPAFSVILAWAIQGQGRTDIMIPSWVKMGTYQKGAGFFQIMFVKNLYLTTILTVVIYILAKFVLYKTKFGLRLMACGEHPQAADSVGIDVRKMRYAGVMISGFLGGIGGLAFVVAAGSGFTGTVAGYGFLGLAVMIFGNWTPSSIAKAAVFFSFFKIVGNYATSIPFLPSFENISNSYYIYQMVPYLVTLVALIFTSKNSRAPKAEGIPYDKGKR